MGDSAAHDVHDVLAVADSLSSLHSMLEPRHDGPDLSPGHGSEPPRNPAAHDFPRHATFSWASDHRPGRDAPARLILGIARPVDVGLGGGHVQRALHVFVNHWGPAANVGRDRHVLQRRQRDIVDIVICVYSFSDALPRKVLLQRGA